MEDGQIEVSSEPGDGGVVLAFAQREMVATFMEGIDPDYKEFVVNMLQELLASGYPAKLVELLQQVGVEKLAIPADQAATWSAYLTPALQQLGNSVVKDFSERMERFGALTNVTPISRAVEFLPKDELASMAESLVNLTSLKRRITLVPETVGGPIDVVVISKGDGFVWMKRKHYFKGEINPHFFTNYFQEYSRLVERANRNEEGASGGTGHKPRPQARKVGARARPGRGGKGGRSRVASKRKRS